MLCFTLADAAISFPKHPQPTGTVGQLERRGRRYDCDLLANSRPPAQQPPSDFRVAGSGPLRRQEEDDEPGPSLGFALETAAKYAPIRRDHDPTALPAKRADPGPVIDLPREPVGKVHDLIAFRLE
jgi:hypothetical protein